MTALIARLSSPARHILLLSTCFLLIFGSTTPNVYAASQTKCVKASLGLRVRSGPGTQYWKKAGLPYGTQVTVNYTQGRWSKVTYSGWRTGWMYSSYLGSCYTYSNPTAVPQSPRSCDPNYSGVCVPNVWYDLDCEDIGTNFWVVGSDPHRFDGDNDGWACERW